MTLVSINEEVFYSTSPIVTVGQEDVALINKKASETAGMRCRICTHRDPESNLHEMFIALAKGSYIHPHSHPGKAESVHIISGEVDIVFFDKQGEIVSVCRMGDYSTGSIFYYRIEEPVFHTLLIHSERLVFHETTNGPFRLEETQFAPWAPSPENIDAASLYQQKLFERVEEYFNEKLAE
jgi:cupin fold WbuC family metalloprotein